MSYSNLHLSYNGMREIDVMYSIICSDEVMVCNNNIVEILMSNVGAVVNLKLSNALNIELLVDRILFLESFDHSVAGENLISRANTGHIIFIMAIFTIIGLLIGLSLVGIPTLRQKYNFQNIWQRTEDLLPIMTRQSSNQEGKDRKNNFKHIFKEQFSTSDVYEENSSERY